MTITKEQINKLEYAYRGYSNTIHSLWIKKQTSCQCTYCISAIDNDITIAQRTRDGFVNACNIMGINITYCDGE